MSQIFQKPPPPLQYVVGLANAVDFELTPVLVSGVAADTPTQDLVLPANTFVQNGQVVTVDSILSTTSLAGGAPTLVKINGTTVANINFSVAAGGIAFAINVKLIRIGATLLNVLCTGYSGIFLIAAPAANASVVATFFKLTGIDFNSAITVAFSSAVPNGGQNITQELCYCNVL